MRQSTSKAHARGFPYLSKLPMRQSTWGIGQQLNDNISKLPMRQSTACMLDVTDLVVSKLPMRQSTAEESERASAPSGGKPISIYFTQSFNRAQEKPIESAFLALVKNFGQNSGTDALSLKP